MPSIPIETAQNFLIFYAVSGALYYLLLSEDFYFRRVDRKLIKEIRWLLIPIKVKWVFRSVLIIFVSLYIYAQLFSDIISRLEPAPIKLIFISAPLAWFAFISTIYRSRLKAKD